MDCGGDDSQHRAGQHHHHMFDPREMGEEFGMARKSKGSAVFESFFMDR